MMLTLEEVLNQLDDNLHIDFMLVEADNVRKDEIEPIDGMTVALVKRDNLVLKIPKKAVWEELDRRYCYKKTFVTIHNDVRVIISN